MTPKDRLAFANAAMCDAETNEKSVHRREAETHALRRAQAHALMGILEHLLSQRPAPRLPSEEFNYIGRLSAKDVEPESPDPEPVKTWEFDDTAQPRIEEHNERAVELGKKYAEDIVSGAGRVFQPRGEVYGDIAPPTSAKMRHCVGCGGTHPLTAFAGRLVEHWDPATLSDIPGPTICDQRECKAEARR